jgi:tetrahydromethanopterin S-methyltransferase subunit G
VYLALYGIHLEQRVEEVSGEDVQALGQVVGFTI